MFLEEVALRLVGELTYGQLAVQRPCQHSLGLLGSVTAVFPRAALGTLSAGLAVMQPIGRPRGVMLYIELQLFTGTLLDGVRLEQTGAQRAPEEGHVPAQGLAEVGLEHQIDDGIVKGGGLGEHGCQGKRHRRHILWVSERCPHGDDGIGTPRNEETKAHCHRELEEKQKRQNKRQAGRVVREDLIC